MKRIITLFALLLSVSAFAQEELYNCFSIIAGKNATADGSVLLAHNEDDSPEQMLNVYVRERNEEHCKHIWCEMPGMEVADSFLNEYGVAVVSNACPSVEDRDDYSEGGVVYRVRVDVAKLARSAREAVKIIGDLVEQYGYKMSGRTYLVADASEGWMVSVVRGRHWVAQRVPDDKVMAIPNNYIIDKVDLSDTENFAGSADLVDYAIKRGWYNPKKDGEFSFKKVYGDPKRYTSDRNVLRQEAALEEITGKKYKSNPDKLDLFVTPKKPVTVQSLIDVLSLHSKSKDGSHNGLICVESTAYSNIFQLRNTEQKETASIMWLCPGHPCIGTFVPWYIGMTESPDNFERFRTADEAERKHFKDSKKLRANYPDGAYWKFVDAYENVKNDYETSAKPILKQRAADQKKIFKEAQKLEKSTAKLSGKKLASKLNNFTAKWYE